MTSTNQTQTSFWIPRTLSSKGKVYNEFHYSLTQGKYVIKEDISL